ncbi:hypothetical protein MTYP_00944 [Methylophilaceae bacterium]|nr:hypothetical protein MTYP_00944 [Methylophilaceae bacterium]
MKSSDQFQSTLDALLRCMRSKADFPALSHSISEINKIASSEYSSINSLTKAILQDFSLTNKLLKLVNTVSYGQFGGKINTISKAVVILGFDTVRNVAMTLILIEFLQNKSQAGKLADEVIASFFAGLVARQLSANNHIHNLEEAMICGIFHHLGKLLATFYFFEESEEVGKLVEQGIPETRASYEVMGISYGDLGTGIAKSWNFPSRLIAGMQTLPGGKVNKPANELDQLNVTVNLANELTNLVGCTDEKDRTQAIRQLVKRYESAVKLDERQLTQALEQGLEEIALRASILNINTKRSQLLSKVSNWTGRPSTVENEPEEALSDQADTAGSEAPDAMTDHDSEAILQAGIQDVTNTLVSEYQLNDILHMVLETVYRGMQFNRTLMLFRDNKSNSMRAGFGLGNGVEQMLPKFGFPLKFEADVFHLAIEKGADIVIDDVAADKIASKIPEWYRNISEAKSFLLLPVMINNKAVACLYADMLSTNQLEVSAKHLGMLRTLRNQAVLAIRQKQ